MGIAFGIEERKEIRELRKQLEMTYHEFAELLYSLFGTSRITDLTLNDLSMMHARLKELLELEKKYPDALYFIVGRYSVVPMTRERAELLKKRYRMFPKEVG